MADRSEKELAILITARDLASKVLKGVNTEAGKLGKIGSQGIASAAGNMERLAAAGAGLAAGGLLAAVKTAGDFQAQLNTINTIAQTTPAGLDAIGGGIRKLARDTGADLTDLTGAYYDLLSAGVSVKDAQPTLDSAFYLSRGALGTTGEAVDVLTTALNSYAGKGYTAAQVSDYMAQAVADGKLKLTDIAGSFADVAPLASAYGINIQQIAASYGFLTAKGNAAAEVTTQMSRAILDLNKPGANLVKLQEKMGKNYADLARQKGLVPALQQMRIDAAKAGVPFQNLFGRVEGLRFALATTGDNYEDFLAEQQKVNDATANGGTTMAQYQERQQGFNVAVGRVVANLKDMAITIGSAVLPVLTPMLQNLADFVDSHQGDISSFARDLAGGAQQMADYLSKVDWGQLAGELKDLAGAGKSIIDAFLGAPPWVQEFLIGGFAANKFTGGAIGKAITTVAGDALGAIAKRVFNGVLGMQAGVVNVRGAVVNTTGGVGGAGELGAGAGAAGGSRLLGAVNILGAVTLAAGSILALKQQFDQFQQTTRTAQSDLQSTADAAKMQLGPEASRNLENTASYLKSIQGMDRIILDTWGSKETSSALVNLGGAILKDGNMTRDENESALSSLEDAQAQAVAHGWKGAADQLSGDIAILRGRIEAGFGSNGTDLERIAAKKLDVSVTVPISLTSTTYVSSRDIENAAKVSARYGHPVAV